MRTDGTETGGTTGRVLVVANRVDPDAGYVGERFEQLGFALDRWWREDGIAEVVPDGTAVLLLLGSSWSVAAPAQPEELASECALVRSAVEQGVPVLGLCYGAQVLAHAHGGKVRIAPSPEVGLVDVETVDEGLVPSGPWWAFHTDVIDLPPDARRVAHNGCGTQAFTLPGALGVQFHPEVRPEILDDWLRLEPAMLSASGRSRSELVELATAREPEARTAAFALVDDFLAQVAGR